MANESNQRSRGRALAGTRINVYNLLPYFLDPTETESQICREYGLTAEQVAAARAFVLNNADTVLARHLEIEARMAAGNPLEVVEQLKKTHESFLKFKDWLAERKRAESQAGLASPMGGSAQNSVTASFPTFREWRAEQESRPEQAS